MGDRVSYLDSKGDVFIKTLVTAESRKDKNNSYHFFLNLDYQESIQAIFMFVIRNKKLNLKIIFVGFVFVFVLFFDVFLIYCFSFCLITVLLEFTCSSIFSNQN